MRKERFHRLVVEGGLGEARVLAITFEQALACSVHWASNVRRAGWPVLTCVKRGGVRG